MTRYIFIFFASIIISKTINAQNQTISYGYDFAGNRTSRSITIPPARPVAENNSVLKSSEEKEGNSDKIFKDSLGKVEIKIYPNPTKGWLRVELLNLAEGANANLTIFDIQGKKLIDIAVVNQSNQLDLSNLPAGSYYLVIKSNDLQTNWTIIKE